MRSKISILLCGVLVCLLLFSVPVLSEEETVVTGSDFVSLYNGMCKQSKISPQIGKKDVYYYGYNAMIYIGKDVFIAIEGDKATHAITRIELIANAYSKQAINATLVSMCAIGSASDMVEANSFAEEIALIKAQKDIIDDTDSSYSIRTYKLNNAEYKVNLGDDSFRIIISIGHTDSDIETFPLAEEQYQMYQDVMAYLDEYPNTSEPILYKKIAPKYNMTADRIQKFMSYAVPYAVMKQQGKYVEFEAMPESFGEMTSIVKSIVGEDYFISIEENGTEVRMNLILRPSLNNSWTIKSFEMNALDIWENILGLLPERSKVISIRATTDFRDKYGNVFTDTAIILEISVDTLKKINWGTPDIKFMLNIADLADKYWVHTGLTK